MEHSRVAYEDATHQFGSFIDSVNSQLKKMPRDKQGEYTNTQTKSEESASVNMPPPEVSPCANTVTHTDGYYMKSRHRGNNKLSNKKKDRKINEVKGYRSVSESLDLEQSKNCDKIKKYKGGNIGVSAHNKELKNQNIFNKMRTCFKMKKKTGKFSINKSTKRQNKSNLCGSQTTTIIGFYGIWSLRNY